MNKVEFLRAVEVAVQAALRQLHRRQVGRAGRAASTSRTSRRSPARPFCEVARSTAEDIELALDAAHAAKDAWGKHLAGRARAAS